MHPPISAPREDRVRRFAFPKEVEEKILGTKRCFILGMGPSLAKIDEEAIREEFTIGVNFILKTDFRPDVLCIADRLRVDTPNLKKAPKVIALEHVLREKRPLFKDLPEGLCDFSIKYHMPFSKSWFNISRFDERLETVYFGGAVITDLAIPLAIYLGIEEICVLGMDGFERSFPSTHVWGNDENLRLLPPTEYLRYQTKITELAAKEGAKVFNGSPGAPTAGFARIDLMKYAPRILRRLLAPNIAGRFIAFGDQVLVAQAAEGGAWRFAAQDGKRFLHHAGGKVGLSAPTGEEAQFIKDSSFFAEASFVNKAWIALRPVSQPDRFVATDDHLAPYSLRPMSGIFSPYFSSFRPYADRTRAEDRAEKLKMLRNLEDLKRSLGNQMMIQDREG